MQQRTAQCVKFGKGKLSVIPDNALEKPREFWVLSKNIQSGMVKLTGDREFAITLIKSEYILIISIQFEFNHLGNMDSSVRFLGKFCGIWQKGTVQSGHHGQ